MCSCVPGRTSRSILCSVVLIFFPSLAWCTSRVAHHDEQIHDRVHTSRTSVRQSDAPRPVEHGRFAPLLLVCKCGSACTLSVVSHFILNSTLQTAFLRGGGAKLIDWFINRLVDGFIDKFIVSSWTSQFCQSFTYLSGTRWDSGFDRVFHKEIPELLRDKGDVTNISRIQHSMREVHGDHSIVDPVLQTPAEKTCRQKHCDKSADAFEVAPNRACTDQSVLSRRCPVLHAEISESPSQRHIPQEHARLRKTIVFEPTSCTNRQCISLDRFVVHSRLTRDNSTLEGRTQHGWVARVQNSSELTFIQRPCSSHDHEMSTCQPQNCHEVLV